MSEARISSNAVKLLLRVLPHGEGLALPSYQSDQAAGLDVVAGIAHEEPIDLQPGARVLVPSGFALEIPGGFEVQIRPRSGLALQAGITVLNSPGTIDADYRGEVKVLLINLGNKPHLIRRGDRIAQLVVAKVEHANIELADELTETRRGEGGFGSTG